MKGNIVEFLPLFVLVFIISIEPVRGRIILTDDSIVVEADFNSFPNPSTSVLWNDVNNLSINNNQQLPLNFQEPSPRSCVTFDKKLGTCLSVKECYPYTRVHQDISNLETWVIGTKGTCHYVEPDGRQVYGVCCQQQQQQQRFNRTLKLEVLDDRIKNASNFSDASSRIVGGETSSNGEFPFMVGIVKEGKVYCGGSLLDEIHVLTAAHCVSRLSSQGVAQLTVVMGASDLRDQNLITKRVYSITRHKGFDSSKLYNDIAIITMDSPVQFSNTVSPVCLYYEADVNHDGKDAIAIGWGNLRDGGSRTDRLQKVTLQLKNQEDCRQNFGNRAPGGIVDHFICASAPGRDSCAGDSGGPLVMNRGNRQCQVGIVSWGIGCATDTYGVYTRISSFDTWINRNRIRF